MSKYSDKVKRRAEMAVSVGIDVSFGVPCASEIAALTQTRFVEEPDEAVRPDAEQEYSTDGIKIAALNKQIKELNGRIRTLQRIIVLKDEALKDRNAKINDLRDQLKYRDSQWRVKLKVEKDALWVRGNRFRDLWLEATWKAVVQ